MEFIGFTVAFTDIHLDTALQECLISQFFITSAPTSTTTTTTNRPPTTVLPTNDNEGTDDSDNSDDSGDNDTNDEPTEPFTCPDGIDFGAHQLKIAPSDGNIRYEIELDDDVTIKDDEWGMIAIFDEEIGDGDIDDRDNLVLIQLKEKYVIFQGIGDNGNSKTVHFEISDRGFINGAVIGRFLQSITRFSKIFEILRKILNKIVWTTYF